MADYPSYDDSIQVSLQLREAEEEYIAGRRGDAVRTVEALHAETGDARVAEVLGKFALMEGEFESALELLRSAKSDHDLGSPASRRVSDLIRLADGFVAYEAGALGRAEASWSEIEGSEVRLALTHARLAAAR